MNPTKHITNLTKSIVWLLLCFSTQNIVAQTTLQPNIPDLEISLLTCDPGTELYSAFGHSAIRVKSNAKSLDLVYNYGTFDFNTPNFYLKFTRGKLNYMLSVDSYADFINAYKNYHKRTVREQKLQLNSQQANRVLAYLENEHLPQNRYYKYDFFFDNCATRIRDVFENTLGNSLKWKAAQKKESFRVLIQYYLDYLPWADLGIDVCLGAPTDKVADTRQRMFLPDFLEVAFANAIIITPDGQSQPFAAKSNTIININNKPATPQNYPAIFIGVFLTILFVISIVGARTQKRVKAIDALVFGILGLLGLLITLLWFFTDHIATANNFCIVWALPTHLLVAFLLLKTTPPHWVTQYVFYTAMLALVLMPLIMALLPAYNLAILWLSVLPIVRYLPLKAQQIK